MMRKEHSTARRTVHQAALLTVLLSMLAAVAVLSPLGSPGVDAQVNVGGIPDPTACYGVADEAAGIGDGLAVINRLDGTATNIGTTGTEGIEAIAFGPGAIVDPSLAQQVLYTFNDTTAEQQFGYINLSTGAFVSLGQSIPSSTFDDIDGMTWDPQLNVFWITSRIGADGAADAIAAYDPFTGTIVRGPFFTGISDPSQPGAADFVTSTGSVYDDFDDIALDPQTFMLYAVLNNGGVGGGLVELDKTTGAIIDYIGVFRPANPADDFDGDGLNITDDIEGLAFFNDGQLYGSSGNNGPGEDNNRFWRIDLNTGLTTHIGQFTDYLDFEALGCLTVNAEIDVEKATNGADADDPNGADVPVVTDTTVTWTYVITNESLASPLADLVLIDDIEGEIFNQVTGATRCEEGVIIDPGQTLSPGASLLCTVTAPSVSGPYANNATVNGAFDPGNGLPIINVTDQDPSHYIGDPPPAILEIIKKVVAGANVDCSAEDFSVAVDLDTISVLVGDEVTFCVQVTNSGGGDATNVVVTDDNFTPGNLNDDFAIAAINGIDLAAGQTAFGGFPYTVPDQGERDNTATVTGTDAVSNAQIPTASDPAGIRPPQGNSALTLVKTVALGDVDCAGVALELGNDLVSPPFGTTVTFCITVSNTGGGAATNVVVVDDQFTPGNAADDVTLTPAGGIDLAPGASETYKWTAVADPMGLRTNTAAATGIDVNSGNPTNEPSDPSSIDPTRSPDLSVVKTVVAGANANCLAVAPAPGLDTTVVALGDEVTFCVTVTNSGNGPATNVTVTDDNFTPANTADDFVVPGLDGVDLAPGGGSATGSFSYTVTSQDALDNTVSATGTNPDTNAAVDGGTDPSGIRPPTGNSVLAIVKTVVLGDVDCAGVTPEPGDGTLATPDFGDTVTFCITVSNTGSGPATNVVVVDDQFTPGNTADDVTLTPAGGIDLAPGASETYKWTHVADHIELRENIAAATGVDVNATGNGAPVPTNEPSDPAQVDPVSAPALTVVKTVAAGANVDCSTVTPAPDLDTIAVALGDEVTFCVTVTNSGNGPATNVTVTDNNFTPADAADDFVVAGLDGIDLAAGESANGSFGFTVTSQDALDNTVSATGTNPDTGQPIPEASDPAGIRPPSGNSVLAIVKTVVIGDVACAGVTPEPGDGTLATPDFGDTVMFCITVSNTGGGPATNVVVVDDQFTPGNTADDVTLTPAGGIDLAPGASETYKWTHVADHLELRENIAAATGVDVNATGNGAPVPTNEPSDPAQVDPIGAPDLTVTKTVFAGTVDCDTHAPEPGLDELDVQVGDTVTFCVRVQNIGNGPATNVTVTDDNFTPGDTTDDTTPINGVDLAPGAAANGTITHVIADQTPLVNTATATGTNPETGGPVDPPGQEPTDPSGVNPPQGNAELAIVKTVVEGANVDCSTVTPAPTLDTLDLVIGTEATFCVTVTNVGDGPATNVVVTDNNRTPADTGDDFVITGLNGLDLAPGQSATGSFDYTVDSLDPQINTAGATGIDVNATGNSDPVPTNEPTDPAGIAPFGIPLLQVVKTVIAGADADCSLVTPDAGLDLLDVVIGDTVTFCVTVSNAGTGPATAVTVTDDAATPADTSDDFDVPGLVNIDLAPVGQAGDSASGQYNFTVVTQDELDNTVTATGTDPNTGTPINPAEDPSGIRPPQGNADLGVIKTVVAGASDCTNVEPQADLDQISVEIGDTVTFCVVATNTGDGPAANVVVTDDNFTPADTTDDFVVAGLDGVALAAGASATGSFQIEIDTLEDLVNTVTVAGEDVNAGGTPVDPPGQEPSDPSGVTPFGIPDLTVVKTVVLGANVDCSGVTPAAGLDEIDVVVGDSVTFCVTVTNIGNGPATQVVVIDDNFTPGDTTDDVTVIDNVDLGPAGSATASSTGSFTVEIIDQTPLVNTVTANGVDPENPGEPIYPPGSEPTDPAGVNPPQGNAELAIIKTAVLGDIVDCESIEPKPGDDSVGVLIGDTVTFCIQVTNIGDGPAGDVVVTDDSMTPDDTADDTTPIGPVDLAPGESAFGSVTFVAPDLVRETNVAKAEGVDVNETGINPPVPIDPPGEEPSDPASIVPFGTPVLEIVKTAAAGGDVDCADVEPQAGADEVVVALGDEVTFCFTVTNTGDGPATEVFIIDDTFDVIVGGPYELAPNGGSETESLTVTIDDPAELRNVARATGVDPENPDEPLPEPEDPAVTLTPAIDLTKQVNRGDTPVETTEGVNELVIGSEGDPIIWTYTVTNTGSTPLIVTEVTDPTVGITAPIPEDEQLILPGESVTVTAPGVISDTGGPSTASVVGQPADEDGNELSDLAPLTASNDAAEGPAIVDLTKQILRGADRDCSTATEGVNETLVGNPGEEVTWCFTITNTGLSPLTDIVFDDAIVEITGLDVLAQAEQAALQPGESYTFAANDLVSNGETLNTAAITAVPSDPTGDTSDLAFQGAPVLASENTAQNDSVDIALEKKVLGGADADCAIAVEGVDEQFIGAVGAAVTWCFTVTNTGSATVTVEEVNDATLNVTIPIPAESQLLAPGDSVTVSLSGVVTEDTIDNVATVEGQPTDPETGEPIIDPETGRPAPEVLDDNTAMNGPRFSDLSLAKSNGLGAEANAGFGSEISYTVTVTNKGPDTAFNVEMTDVLPTGLTVVGQPTAIPQGWECSVSNAGGELTCSADSLAVGAAVDITYTAVLGSDAPTGQGLVNTATVTSDSVDPTPDDNVDSDVIRIPPPGTSFSPPTPVVESDPPPTPPDEVLGTMVTPPLAVTGSEAVQLATLASVALWLGGMLVVASRRRRRDI